MPPSREPEPASPARGWWWLLRSAALLLLGLGLLAYLLVRAGTDAPLRLLPRADPTLVGASLGAVLLGFLVRVLRWRLLYRGVPLVPSSEVYFVGLALNAFTPPGAAETARAVIAQRRHGVPPARTLVACGVERLLDMVIIVSLCLLGLPLLGVERSPWHFAIPALLLAGGFLLLLRPRMLARISRPLHARSWGKRPARLLDHVVHDLTLTARRHAPLAGAAATSLALWALHLAAGWTFLASLGSRVDPFVFAGATAVSLLTGGLLLVPGGLGVREATLVALLGSQGVPLDVAVTSTVVLRLTNDALSVLLGLTGVLGLATKWLLGPGVWMHRPSEGDT